MAHYSIYIPEASGANPEHLVRLGLGELQKEGDAEWCDVIAAGPDGGRGIVGTWRRGTDATDPLIGVHLDRQVWKPAAANPDKNLPQGAFWIGWEKERPPEPRDLMWKEQHPGSFVTLGDDRQWFIPHATKLPARHGLDPATGIPRRLYADEYAEFCGQSEKYALLMCEQLGVIDMLKQAKPELSDEEVRVDFTLVDCWGFCCTALGLNYRLCSPVIDALKLLNDRTMVSIVGATIELSEILEVRDQKKNSEYVSIHVG